MKIHTKGMLALLLLSAASLTACGGPATSSDIDFPDEPTLDADWKGKVTWWVTYAEDKVRGDEDDSNYAAWWYAVDTAAAFTKANPNIEVEVVYRGTKTSGNDYVGVANAVSAGLATGDITNLVTTYGTYIIPWANSAANPVFDVTAHGRALAKEGDIPENVLKSERDQYGGTRYLSLPYSKSTEAMQINREVFAKVGAGKAGADAGSYVAPTSGEGKKEYKVPTTFTEMMELAAQMKADYPSIFNGEKEGDYVKAWPCIYEGGDNLFYTVMQSAGIPVETDDKEATKAVLFNNDEAKKVVAQLKKWNNDGLICTANQLPISTGTYHQYPSNVFGAGNAFMIFSSTANAPWMAADGYSVGFEAMPAWNKDAKKVAISQGPSICVFNKKDKNEVAASLKFYDYLTNAENSAILATQTSYLPLRKSSKEVASVKDQIAKYNAGYTYETAKADKKSAYGGATMVLNDTYVANNAYFMSPVNDWSYKVRTQVKAIIDGVFDGKATTDEEINTLVENQFKAAYEAVLK